uniref:Uncharacterized protein n=1 Tax=Astyanax mexicanus TaxID=7994 RepID=A0A3B1JXP2_ASTMX
MKASVLKLCPFRLSRLSSGPNMKGWRTYPRPLFEWRWADIAAECERYLAPNGFEDIVTNPVHPWWPEYQPISYKTCSSSSEQNGIWSEVDLMHVVNLILCVRDIYVDALCTYFNANTKEFPSIPFHRLGLNDAKCNTGKTVVWLVLLDLALEERLRSGSADYNERSYRHGVAGSEWTPASTWAWESSALFTDASITQHHNGSQWFRPFIFQEVMISVVSQSTAAEYTGLGRVTEFKYGAKLGNRLCVNGTEKACTTLSKRTVPISRGHGAGEHPSSHFWDALQDAVALMLAHPYGVTRVMSSFRWTVTIQRRMDHRSYGDGTNQAVPINATPTCGDAGSMVIFRNVVGGRCSPTGDNGSNFRCFRSGIHFRTLDATLATGLPGGTYCDVISGQKEEVVCNWKAG